MRSQINWGLLGLIIERSSYAYDLAQRFERRFGTVMAPSNVGHVYTALGALEGRSMVTRIPGARKSSQPRPHYRATALGVEEYRKWLIAQVEEDRRRGQMLVLALGALTNQPQQLLEVMDGYEQAWLSAGMRTPIAGASHNPPEGASALIDRLRDEENRLTVGAKLEWVEYARQELEKLRDREGRDEPA